MVTDDKEIMERCKKFRHHGQSETMKYEYDDLGYNYRITDLCAAIGLAQVKKIDRFNKKRIENAQKLHEGLKNIAGLIVPKVKEGNKHVFNQYTIRITGHFKSNRKEFILYLEKQGIGYGIYYPKPLHLHPHFRKMGYKEGDFPVAENIANQVLSLPVHPSVTEEEINFIIDKIQTYAT